MQLTVQEHLVRPSLVELENRVPEEMLASMWPRVDGEVKSREEVAELAVVGRGDAGWAPRGSGEGQRAGEGGGQRPRFGWLVPILAAATLILLFSTSYLSLERGRLREQEAYLAQQVAEQQRWLSELNVGADADPVARTAALAGRNPWLRALSRQESITVQGLQLLLERMPGDRIIMTQAQVDAALRSRTPLSLPLLRDVLSGIETRDGVRARDLLRALEGMGVGPDVSVPTADLMSLLS
jgi:hypothetical protein